MPTTRPYSRVYHEIETHPRFAGIFDNPTTLGWWLRCLITSDRYWPESAPMPIRNPAIRTLIDAGLILEESGNRFRMRGQNAERERRSSVGRNANAIRWESVRSPNGVPRRDETRKDEDGGIRTDQPGTFMGFRPRRVEEPPSPGEAAVPRHNGQHADCAVCATIRGEDPYANAPRAEDKSTPTRGAEES